MKAIRSVPLPLAIAIGTATAIAAFAAPVGAQQHRDPHATIAAQQAALAPLSILDGRWRGTARMTMPDGSVHEFTQTERIGPLLDGSIKLIEGRSYDADGNTVFNAFAVLSFDPASDRYTLHSHALGEVGDFAFVPTGNGYRWEIPAGPATIRYTATIEDDRFVETGERIIAGQQPVEFFRMQLQRVGDSRWPAADPVAPR